MADTE